MSGWVEVGHCPKCGAPMYSPLVWMGVTPPPVYRTCNCFEHATKVVYTTQAADEGE